MENKGSRFDTGALARHEPATALEKAKDAGSQAVDKAREMGNEALEKAKGYASNVSEQASRIGHKVEETYEAGRDYVTHRGLSGMGEDLTDVIRKNPLPAVLLGVGIGFLLARALRED